MKLDCGQMRTKIEIQTNTITNTSGSETDSWATTITTISKKITSGGREFWAAQKINAETSAIFIIRYRSAPITLDMRIKEGLSYFEILNINNPNDENQWLILSAKEVV